MTHGTKIRRLHPATRRIMQAMQLTGPIIPEHAMLVQMTDRAVRDLEHQYGSHFESAVDWFSANSQEPFTFEVVCDFLSLDSDTVRLQLAAMGLLA